ncbi:MAG: adenosine deaminase [Opitutae bacterium]|nr:adenosine deaminase [Opitutae bacterium]
MRYTLILAAVCLAGRALAGGFAERFEAIRKTAKPAELYALLYALPKGGDLHNHLGGAVRPEWWHELGTNPALNGGDTFYTRVKFSTTPDTGEPLTLFRNIRGFTFRQLPPAVQADYVRLDQLTPELKQAWLDSLRLDRPDEGRAEFFGQLFQRIGQMFQNPHVTAESIVWNLKAFGAEHLRYLEGQTHVHGMTDNEGNAISAGQYTDFLRQRLARPDAVATGVTLRLQLAVLRFLPDAEQSLEEDYAFVAANRDLFVGLNLVGIEDNGRGYPRRFLEKFREMRRRYPALALSIHAGERDGPDTHIRDTLLLGASRIGHGVNILKDPDTYLLMRGGRWLVECNLISNRLLEYVPDLSKHHFPELLRTGVPVCLNTDDRGMWDSNLTDEYYTAVTTYNLSWDEIVQIGRNSLTHSFAQPDVKAKLLADYERAVVEFEKEYLPPDSLSRLAAVKPVTYGYGLRNWGFPFAQ